MIGRKFLVATAALAGVVVAYAAVRPQGQTRPIVIPFKASGIYALGEKAGWTLSLPAGADTTNSYPYTIKTNNQDVVKSGTIDFKSGPVTIDYTATSPCMLYMQIKLPEPGRSMAFGAAVSPGKIPPAIPRPKDFDTFWKSKIKALKAIPENPVLTPGESGKPEVDFATIKMDHVKGAHVYGQIAKPSKPGKYPALLILQWASPPYPLQKPWVVDRAREGWIALNIEPHDVLPDGPPSYYSGLPDAIKNYQSIGQDDRDKSYFLQMYLADYRAVDYLTHRPDWDGKTLVVMGTSMGGQQSLCVGGLHPKITHIIVEEPAGCDLNGAAHGRQVGYPFFPNNNPQVLATAQYFDAVNFASHIKATSLVAMGFVDTIAPPVGIWAAFNQIKGKKEAAPMVDAPHNNIATQQQQLPYTNAAFSWLNTLVKGGRVAVQAQPELKK